jgi:hypothetical protein
MITEGTLFPHRHIQKENGTNLLTELWITQAMLSATQLKRIGYQELYRF